MNLDPSLVDPDLIVSLDSNGRRIADSTKQVRWRAVLFGNLMGRFRTRTDIFVAVNQFWYPVESHPEIRIAPDVLVVLGWPRGDRGFYRQWKEANIPLTIVFDILSPRNTVSEMDNRLLFYEDYGVEEYYIYDPDNSWLIVYIRQGDVLWRVRPADGFVSPRLGIRFDLSGPEMVVYRPDGQRFLTFEELEADRDQTRQQAEPPNSGQ